MTSLAPKSLQRNAYVLGGHITKFIGAKHPDFIWKKHPDFGIKQNPDLEQYIDEAINGALETTGHGITIIIMTG